MKPLSNAELRILREFGINNNETMCIRAVAELRKLRKWVKYLEGRVWCEIGNPRAS